MQMNMETLLNHVDGHRNTDVQGCAKSAQNAHTCWVCIRPVELGWHMPWLRACTNMQELHVDVQRRK